MIATRLRFGIPDIELPRTEGGTVNPASFAGHVLVVVFCPTTSEREAAELADFRRLSSNLSKYDGWLLTVSEMPGASKSDPQLAMATASDTDGRAWAAFREIAPPHLKLDRNEGAAFLFGRGGSLQRVWPGPGHAAGMLDELARPCFETPDTAA